MFDTHFAARKILIVDDEPAPRNLESFALEGTGRYYVLQASNATDALTMLSSEKFDCLVVDVDMPDMSGLELIHLVRSRMGHDRLPIVLVLPTDPNLAAEEMVINGATRAISKPFDPWDLARLLDGMVGPFDGSDHVLSVEAVLRGFPHPTMILDEQHRVLLANGAFYRATDTGIDECFVYCMEEMHSDDKVPTTCPLEECMRTGEPAERAIETTFGDMRVSVFPLAVSTTGGQQLYLHVTQPTD